MTTTILDCETLGLLPQAPIWEFAAVRIEDDGSLSSREHFQIVHDPTLADPDYPQWCRDDYERRYNADDAVIPSVAARAIADIVCDRAVIAGSNPGFDMTKLTDLLARFNITPGWHYHPLDVPNRAEGWLAGQGRPIPRPWKSDAISRACGINPDDYERHTAMGDVEWCWDLFIRTGGTW